VYVTIYYNVCRYEFGSYWGKMSSLLYICWQFCLVQTIILPVILYGCEIWSLALREEHRLRVFENRVLRRIFRPKRDEVTGEWKKLHNKELHDL
jgi:hypothetical protein